MLISFSQFFDVCGHLLEKKFHRSFEQHLLLSTSLILRGVSNSLSLFRDDFPAFHPSAQKDFQPEANQGLDRSN